MRAVGIASGGLALLIASTTAVPAHFPPPPGGWESIDYPPPPGGWESIDYPPPPGGWESLDYSRPSGENMPSHPPAMEDNSPACPDNKNQTGPFQFTSTYSVVATPDQVVNGTTPTGGLPGCMGYYDFGIDSNKDLICWSIKLVGFRGNYSSAALTATHIHEAARGQSGPPRLVFPNPVGNETESFSYGCMTGPFTTGIVRNGEDTGVGFMVKQIEAEPSAFLADAHSSLAVPGAVRGQIA